MFFGLTNSLATFQTMMNSVFAPEIAEQWLTIYMDDMAIHMAKLPNETDGQHLERHRKLVKRILAKLQEHNLFLKPEKMHIRTTKNRISGSQCRPRNSTNG